MEKTNKITWSGKIALITGASSGIGAATARLLAQKGMTVFLAARRGDRLKQVADEIAQQGGRAGVLTVNLTQEDERQRLYREAIMQYGRVDVLVNNAGFGWYGYFTDMAWKTAQEMIQVNVTAVVQLTRLFLPVMQAQKSGHIINVGSIAGGLPNQGIAIYSATKSFLDTFTTVLYRELRGSPIHISVVRPGPVSTEFFELAKRQPSGSPIPAETIGIHPDRVAHCIWRLLQNPRRAVYIPRGLAVTPWIEHTFGWLIDWLGPVLLRRQKTTL